MQSNIPEIVLGNPVLLGVLTVLVLAVVAYQRTLTYPEYATIHTLKTVLFRALDPWARKRGRRLINDKGGREDAEFLTVWDGSARDVLTTLRSEGWDYHLVSTDKRRDGDLDDGHAVIYHDNGDQTEVYVFELDNGKTEVYGHVETATTNPEGHLSDAQTDGDAHGVISAALSQ